MGMPQEERCESNRVPTKEPTAEEDLRKMPEKVQ